MKEMPKTIEELNQYLKDYITKNLSIVVDGDANLSGEVGINVMLMLNGERISVGYFWL